MISYFSAEIEASERVRGRSDFPENARGTSMMQTAASSLQETSVSVWYSCSKEEEEERDAGYHTFVCLRGKSRDLYGISQLVRRRV